MRTFFRHASLLILLCAGISCSPRINSPRTALPEIIVTDSLTQKFNLQLDFMKHHFSGLLIARRMDNDEVRLLFSSYFGLSLFDFSFRNDSLYINSCIEPMRKKNLLKILDNDLKLVFIPGQPVRIKEKNTTFEKRINGKGIGKAIITLSGFSEEQPRRVQIKHPWIRLKIQLDKLD